jgi:hypothetical protein
MVDEVIDKYACTKRYVKNLAHQVEQIIKIHKYQPQEIEQWVETYRLKDLVNELKLAKTGQQDYLEGYSNYNPAQLDHFYLMILDVYSTIASYIKPPKGKVRQRPQPQARPQSQPRQAVIIYDEKSELIKYLEGDSIEILPNKVVGFDKSKSWIKIAKGKNFTFPVDSWDSTFEFVSGYKAKLWPATGKISSTSKILAAK